MDSIFSVCLGKEESSHKDEQERLNENYLEISICIPKRLRDIVDPCLEKSEPKGCCQLATQIDHKEVVAAWQMAYVPRVCKDKQVPPVLPIWVVMKENVNLKLC